MTTSICPLFLAYVSRFIFAMLDALGIMHGITLGAYYGTLSLILTLIRISIISGYLYTFTCSLQVGYYLHFLLTATISYILFWYSICWHIISVVCLGFTAMVYCKTKTKIISRLRTSLRYNLTSLSSCRRQDPTLQIPPT